MFGILRFFVWTNNPTGVVTPPVISDSVEYGRVRTHLLFFMLKKRKKKHDTEEDDQATL